MHHSTTTTITRVPQHPSSPLFPASAPSNKASGAHRKRTRRRLDPTPPPNPFTTAPQLQRHSTSGPVAPAAKPDNGPCRAMHRRTSSADATMLAASTQEQAVPEAGPSQAGACGDDDDVLVVAQRAKHAAAIIEAAYLTHMQRRSARQERRDRLRQRCGFGCLHACVPVDRFLPLWVCIW